MNNKIVSSSSRLPVQCPSCERALEVRRLECVKCETAVEGKFSLSLLVRLDAEEQIFMLNFLKLSGSLKDLARKYEVSYPTVRNRLDALIEKVKAMESQAHK